MLGQTSWISNNWLFRKKPLLLLLFILSSQCSSTKASRGGSPPFYHHQRWGAAGISSPRSTTFSNISKQPSFRVRSDAVVVHDDDTAKENDPSNAVVPSMPPRGGQGANTVVRVVGSVTEILVQCGKLVLPPTAALVKFVVNIYRVLPKDAIVAQVGLVSCFAGGYYPTLFSSLQAAQHCGWNIMVQAIQDLTDEALRVIDALEEVNTSQFGFDDDEDSVKRQRAQSLFRRQTSVVLATVDPMKINQAAGALYTTWLGVSSVLEKEYARVITLSMTMAGYIEKVAKFIIAPPAYLCVAEDYHQWVPVVIGWGCKALAMNIAWRIQRLMTAATSAVTGGLLFARAISRMLSKRGIRLFGLIQEDHETTAFDEVIGFMVAGLGFYAQFESQWRNGFSFQVPFPFYLVTWPFDFAENWIQWQITK